MNKTEVSRTILRLILLIFLIAPGLYVMGQSAPTAVTGAASGETSYEATLNGTVNANGESTTVTFEYGTDTNYGVTYTADQSPVSGSTDTAVSAIIYELSPNTTYHYRVVAQSVNGTTYGADMTFAALPQPPTVLTQPASAFGVDSATLNGAVNPWGVSTDVTFEYGTDTGYGTTVTADQSPVNSAFAFPVSTALTGLSGGVTYHYRVVAVSTGGTTYGDDMTFTLTVSPPTAVTGAATAVGSETATLNGTANANGTLTTVTFEYGLDTNYGTTVTATQNPLTGAADTAVSRVVDDVLPNTTYFYRLTAVNSGGTTYGADMTFTTLPSPPTSVTGTASPVGTTTATLNGTVNANDAGTTVTFEYGPDTGYGSTVSADQGPLSGSVDTAVSAALTGLSEGVTYHFRVVAVNAGGTTYGADMTFTTGAVAPTAVTNAAGGIGTTTATLNGTVNANNGSTTVTFQYGLNTNYDRSVDAVPDTVTGSSDTAVGVPVSDLIPGATYHFRVAAVNAGGTTYGADMTFTTRAAPAVTTGAASAVSTSGATLNGTVNAFNDSTTVTFEYGTTTAYGTTVTAAQSPVSGLGDTAVSNVLTGLTPSTVYYYRAVGQNVNGTTYGAGMTFTTSVGPPTVTTGAASSVINSGATLNGTVTANNASTTVTFEYGTTVAYGSTVTADQSPVTGVNTAVSAVLTGLSNNTTYHYRVVGQNSSGTSYGADMTFATSFAPSAVTGAAAGVGASFATLNGTVNANNFSTTVTFQYGTTTSYGSTVSADPSFVSGNIDTAVSAAVTGLLPNTTYHYRVSAQGFGTTNGADMTFTTGSGPTAVTNAASSIGETGATLNGTVNANNTGTTVTFEYGLNTGYGKSVIAAQSPVSGGTDTTVGAVLVNNLVPNTTYHYRVVAQNVNDTAYGADMTFTTTGSAPTAVTNEAAAVSETGATLRGKVTAENDSTTVTFEYGLTTAYGTTVTADQSPVTGNSNTTVSKAVTGLTVNTTYHFRVVATNGSGTTYGSDRTFFTSSTAPTAATLAATNIGFTTGTLNGTVNANNNSTTVTFEYGPDTGYGRIVTAGQSPVTGSTDTAVSADVTDLTPNSTVHYRVVAAGSSGTVYGSDMTFVTDVSAPTATTTAASAVDTESAVLNGLVGANNAETTVTFDYGTDTNYGSTVTADQGPVNGTVETAVSAGISGLTPGTMYHYRVTAENSQGTTHGADMTFTTGVIQTPTVTTAPVTKIKTKTAKSGGDVTDEGASAVTARGVVWSTVPNPTLADDFTVNDFGPGPFNSTMNQLTESTTYYVRAYAVNSFGTAYGEEFQFTTNSKKVSVSIIQPKDGDTVSGTVNIKVTAKGKRGASSIARVEFYIDGTKIGERTKVPFKLDWDTTAYTEGSHTIKAVAFDENNESSQDSVLVTVTNASTQQASISTNRDRLNFKAIPFFNTGYLVTRPQALLVKTGGDRRLNWTVTEDAGWLYTLPKSGKGSRWVVVYADPNGMAAGTYSTTIEIAATDYPDQTAVVNVYMTISDSSVSAAPFGSFETPVDGSTVSGNISVSGWVLDDIEVTRVAIYRAPVGTESPGHIFIGDAYMVDGARPDTERIYADYPLGYEAGWGYMLMTNLLPNGGNGTFTLYAKATDKEEKTVILGSKTIHVDNANAVKPFGTLDTPGPGETVGGTKYVNYGWALTPQLGNTIPFDGSTITVWVDGKAVGSPVYNQYRPDIAGLFSGYGNSEGAGGYFNLDTTPYAEGLHSIAWSVTDDAGNSEGIGSRYFYILNGEDSSNTTAAGMTADSLGDLEHIELRPMEPGFITKGYRTDAEAEVMLPGENGTTAVTIKELERVELEFGQPVTAAYLVAGDRLRDLPIGSTLDGKSRRFSWIPGPGYLGSYLMVFVLEDSEGRHTRTFIRVTIEPGFKK